MDARSAVRLGQRVRDVDGHDMGRVTDLYDLGFAVVAGPPVLFRRDTVLGYGEVLGEEDGVLVVARSPRALFQLASGELPDTWR